MGSAVIHRTSSLATWAYALWWLTLAVWAVTLARTFLRWRRGRPSGKGATFSRRFVRVARDALAQKSTFRDPWGGAMHVLIVLGGTGLAVCAYLTHIRLPDGPPASSAVYWLLDLFSAMLLAGLLLSVFRRATRRVVTRWEDGLLLTLLIVLALTNIASYALLATPGNTDWEASTLYSGALGRLFKNIPTATLSTLYAWTSTFFHALFFVLLILAPMTKLRHILAAPVSLWMHNPDPLGKLAGVDLERQEGSIGARLFNDLTRKELIDLDACMQCGRCTTVCPVARIGGSLDPMQALAALGKETGTTLAERVGTGALWTCATCLACADVCPVAVEPMRHLIDLRRERVLDEAEFPHELISLYRGLELRGNPWRLHEQNRIPWASDLDVPVLAEGNETDVLLWIGCLTAYDNNQQRDARALVRVLRAAGVEFATLGAAERCCGDPGRRTGNEHLWAVLTRQNIGVLQSRRFRCIVTLCPHCMNTLKNEYSLLDGRFEVAHAAKLVAKLIQEGRLPLNDRKPGLESASRLVTYHDPCYLARGNGSVGKADSVRSVLHALPGIELVEMAAHGRNAVCCGGGGGQMWLERPANQRVENARADQILSTPASACLTACPYCTQMLNDGLNATDANIRARSWIELVSERVPE